MFNDCDQEAHTHIIQPRGSKQGKASLLELICGGPARHMGEGAAVGGDKPVLGLLSQPLPFFTL